MGSRSETSKLVNFIARANEVHQNKFTYANAVYVNDSTKVEVTCSVHGPFMVRPGDHIRKSSGCPACNGNKKLTTAQFIANAIAVHGDTYDYTNTKYKNASGHVAVECKEHGVFKISPSYHVHGAGGCPQCNTKNVTKDQFIHRAMSHFGDGYDYTLVDYINFTTPVTLVCSTHGEFIIIPADHVGYHKVGCQKCGMERSISGRIESMEETYGTTVPLRVPGIKDKFIQTNQERYGRDHYNQRNIPVQSLDILNNHDLLNELHVVDKRCWTDIGQSLHVHPSTANAYGKSHGIPTQHFTVSTGEREVVSFLSTLSGIEVIQNDRTILCGKELDIVIPSKNVAIEYCGLYWHSEKYKPTKYHSDKQLAASKVGIQLLTLYEDEWLNDKLKVQSKLRHLLGLSDSVVVHARKTSVIELDTNTKKKFLDQNHIQGDGPATISHGLIFNNQLVAVMSWLHANGKSILSRYATSHRVVGGFTKLLRYYQQTHAPKIVESFGDLRWSTGHLYNSNGWSEAYRIPPDYYWTNGRKRFHKFQFRHAAMKSKFANYDPNLSESDNCHRNGLFKIYDCGKIKYTLDFT